ncbi:MAG: glycoside hydrolase family 97 protein [Bacteroidales bacterium]|nr:glycoside hydrolase family 97 protein [Bacteroidales bacterium]MDD3431416.1 glycoside hydrolase family 97 protein [Bacteroidales bacterium]MDD4361309.1 glycoside hydrolase family 97 protein [Bacteroidales bacterium]MDD4430649.1 glycoside hydrolase family 97 protein [Bacteroidales bacterium]
MRTSFLLVLSMFLGITALNAKEYQLQSPDGNLQIVVNVEKEISWSAQLKGKPVVEKAVIAMELSDRVLGLEAKPAKQSVKEIKQEIQVAVPHKDALIEDHCNELSLQFREKFSLTFRAYNDGVAYRFSETSRKPYEVLNEKMDLVFPTGAACYFSEEQSTYSHNESWYPYIQLSDIAAGRFCSMPLLIDLPGQAKVLVTETALHSYPGMFLKSNGTNGFVSKFPPYVLETQAPRRGADRNEIISKEADYIAKVATGRDFPWRVFIISDKDADLVESNLTYQLAEPCALENTAWIKPGKVAWDWYNANNIFGVDFKSGLNTETYKYYIDFASDNKIEYVILDEGWTKSTTEILANNPNIDVKELIEYGKQKKVGIILWVLWKPLNANMKEILETYSAWGARGIKVDFMQRNDQYMVESYEQIAAECARLNLLVDYHGAFKPSGLRRKYPNVLSYEGVKGNENNKWSADITPEHNLTLPFTRMVAGPMDYTPGAMLNAHPVNHKISYERPMGLGTRCHEVAKYIVYESPLQMMCESPSIYKKEQESVDFITRIPVVWDETRVLDAKVADYIVVARRKDNIWYVGAMTDASPRELDISLSFLGEGNYILNLMKDGLNADRYAQDYKLEKRSVNKTEVLKIKMVSGGGWAAILEP